MKIYLAGSCSVENRTLLHKIAKVLRKRTEDVYCPYEHEVPNAWGISQEEWARAVFEADTKAIKECDVMVVVTPGRESTAGTNWEQGYAYALGKKVLVLQTTNNATSLMTYCGSTAFRIINTDSDNYNLPADIGMAIRAVEREIQLDCPTVLT